MSALAPTLIAAGLLLALPLQARAQSKAQSRVQPPAQAQELTREAAPSAAAELAEIRSLLARGLAQAALERSAQALKAHAEDAGLQFQRAVALMDLHREAEAQAALELMTQQFPELPDPWNNLGLLYARSGRLDQAREALDTALRNAPGFRLARTNLGWVYLMLAAREWQQALGEGPADAPLRERLQAVRTLLAAQTP